MVKEKEEKQALVLRIPTKVKERLENLSDRRDKNLTNITNEALQYYLDHFEYTFEDLLEIAETIPSLRINKEKIKHEMKGCPSPMCKQIIDTIKGKSVFLFEEENLDSLVKRISEIEKENLFGIFIHITSKTQEDVNKVNESLQKITEILNDIKLNLGAGMKGNNHHKILLFVSYDRKENGKL